MPPLYLMDDYDRCLDEGSAKLKAVYCYTRTQIKPNDTSPLWKIIEVNLNKNKLNNFLKLIGLMTYFLYVVSPFFLSNSKLKKKHNLLYRL